VAGLFLFNEKNKVRFDIDRSQISQAAVQQDIANGAVIFVQPTVGQYASSMSFIQGDRQLKSKAVFGQVSQQVTDTLKLTAGARYTKDHKFDIGGKNWACPNWPANTPLGTTVLTADQLRQLVTPGTGLANTHNIGPGGAITAASCGNIVNAFAFDRFHMIGSVYLENIFPGRRNRCDKSNFSAQGLFHGLNPSGSGSGIGRINFVIIFMINDFHFILLFPV